MRKRQRDIDNSQIFGEFRRHTMKSKRRPPRRKVDHLEIAPAHTAFPARSDGLHPRFFGGESGGSEIGARSDNHGSTNFQYVALAEKSRIKWPA